MRPNLEREVVVVVSLVELYKARIFSNNDGRFCDDFLAGRKHDSAGESSVMKDVN